VELDSPDVELVGLWRVPSDEVEQAVARTREQRDGADEQKDRDERPQPPAPFGQPLGESARLH
jgi:hypothetical protein